MRTRELGVPVRFTPMPVAVPFAQAESGNGTQVHVFAVAVMGGPLGMLLSSPIESWPPSLGGFPDPSCPPSEVMAGPDSCPASEVVEEALLPHATSARGAKRRGPPGDFIPLR